MGWPVIEPRVLGAFLDVAAHVYGGAAAPTGTLVTAGAATLDEAFVSALDGLQQQCAQAAAAVLLDRLPFALVAVDAEGRLIYANECGLSLTAAGDRLRREGEHVLAAREEDRVRFRSWIAALAQAQRSSGSAECWQLVDRSGRQRLGVLAVRAMSPQPTVILLLADPRREQVLRALLRSLFGLTRAESELCLLLLQGLSLEEAARQRSVASATVRGAWQSISWKTGGLAPAALYQVLRAALLLPIERPERGSGH